MIAIAIPEMKYHMMTSQNKWSFEYPENHNRGAAYGQKNAPAIAAIGAIGAISSGVALGVGTLAGALTIAGGVASLVGSFTGNKFLSSFGMVAGLAGGITGAFTAGGSTGLDAFNYNPFEGGFGGSQLGAAASKAKSFFGDIFDSSSAVGDLGITGNAEVANIVDSSIPGVTEASFIKDAGSSFGNTAKTGIDLTAKVGVGAAKAASSGGGLFSQLLGNKDIMSAASGALDGYNAFQTREQQQPYADSAVDLNNARTEQSQFETQLAKDRYNNQQFQPNAGIGVNQNAQVFGANPVQGSPRIAVAIGGEVKYLTTEEYAALKQQQSGGGLLQQGAA